MSRFLAVLLAPALLVGCRPLSLEQAALPVRADAPAPSAGALTLWQDASIFDAVRRLLGAATRSVHVEMYEIERRDLLEMLAAAQARGSDVRVIVDPSVPVSVRSAAWLRSRSIPVREYPVDERSFQIDHVKLLATESAVLVGGMNWGSGSARNHDFAIEASAAAAARAEGIFERDWSFAGGDPLAPAPPPAAGGSLVLLQTAPPAEVRTELLKVLRGARRRVLAEVFVLTDPEIVAEIAAAHRRGADVRVVVDPRQDANLPAISTLRRAGVRVRGYPAPPGAKLHAKAVLADGELVLGSANWSHGGLSVNHELDVATADAGVRSAYQRRFEADWAAV